MSSNEEAEVRKGPWTMEEDLILINYIANHGDGVWNNLARSAGLKRTGKSCRLRWLNYLKPDVRRGNITPQEQLLIMDLHARWGNKWSKIARQLPGRTDNEIKNYWRTRIQKKDKDGASIMNYSSSQMMTHEEGCSSHAADNLDWELLSKPIINYPSILDHQYYQHLNEPNYHHSETNFVQSNGNNINFQNDIFWDVEDLWPIQPLDYD